MEASHWDFSTWRDLIESGGIIATLLFSAYTHRRLEKAQRISNLIAMTRLHNKLWQEPASNPKLLRVTDPRADVQRSPVTSRESLFVQQLIVHLSTAYRAQKEGVFTEIEGLKDDVRQFFDLPIPNTVWEKAKSYQNSDFVSFVENCLKRTTN